MTKIRYPREYISIEEAAQILQSHYNSSGQLKPLPSEIGQNFLITTARGERTILKIAHPEEKLSQLQMENRMINLLNRKADSPMCPRLIPDKDGNEIVQQKDNRGNPLLIRMVSFLPGTLLARYKPHTPQLMVALGEFMGRLDGILQSFKDPAACRFIEWDLREGEFIANHLDSIPKGKKRSMVQHHLHQFQKYVVPQFDQLRISVIHNDGNDYNLFVNTSWPEGPRIEGIIDFGDVVESFTVNEIAITAAYAMMDKQDPLETASHLLRGYHGSYRLLPAEIEVLFYLICMRLCVSVTLSAIRKTGKPENDYLAISEQPAWNLLEKLQQIDPDFACYSFRQACGITPCPQGTRLVKWLKKNKRNFHPLLGERPKPENIKVFDLSVGSPDMGGINTRLSAHAMTAYIFNTLLSEGATLGVGCYRENRLHPPIKRTPGQQPLSSAQHLGIDLYTEARTPIYAPLDGTVVALCKKYFTHSQGPTVILKHITEGKDPVFYTLYAHISQHSLRNLTVGKKIKQGDLLGFVGYTLDNGSQPPHVHFQIIADLMGNEGAFPLYCPPHQQDVWTSICPDPNLILLLPEKILATRKLSQEKILEQRQLHINPSLSISYQTPLHIVRGYMQYLYDFSGRAYLDAVNNVPHVGHCHPRVVKAAQRQMAVLNTNTRYLHQNLINYAARLCEKLPDPLQVCVFVNSGSEANELALRMASSHTRSGQFIVHQHAYHGNTNAVIDISPYKFDGPGGAGCPDHIHKVKLADCYRGDFIKSDPEAGEKYARDVDRVIQEMARAGKKPAAFIHESLPGVAGQIIFPEKYLQHSYRFVREAGGVCIADEVQAGFGRVGTHFWAFELQDVVPDIVTLGKPIGNGHPLGAVITTREIASSFDNGMEYFNTFGGNPVSCAVGLEVLDVIESEGLQENARQVGGTLLEGLSQLQDKYELIGDVRGAGLYVGIELVTDRQTLDPAADQAAYVVERMKDEGILVSTDGPLHNVIKIKPPLVFSQENARYLITAIDKILDETFLTK